jgi:hypothetical protein
MSSIPPAGHAGLIQAHGAQRHAGEARAKETSSEAQRLGDTFSEKLKEVIENDDLDSQVYADGEGAGGHARQRADDEPPEDSPEPDPEPEPDGPHLDIQA